jgi:hypothetical protein
MVKDKKATIPTMLKMTSDTTLMPIDVDVDDKGPPKCKTQGSTTMVGSCSLVKKKQ